MKNKSDGFTSIECVVSLSIICTLVYMVSVSLYNNYFILNSNISKIEMTNIETINDYEIRKIVEEDEYYYKCYKIVIEVKKKEQIRRLESYVLQQ